MEVVFKEKNAFWLYCVLNETILPLNFYTNTLYPQAFLEYTIKLVKEFDDKFFEKSGDAINMFCLKSYYSLFTNITIDPECQVCDKSEIAYFMLDLLFLFGDPKRQTTLLDEPFIDNDSNVGETFTEPSIYSPDLQKFRQESPHEYAETKVRIDRTS